MFFNFTRKRNRKHKKQTKRNRRYRKKQRGG